MVERNLKTVWEDLSEIIEPCGDNTQAQCQGNEKDLAVLILLAVQVGGGALVWYMMQFLW